MSRIKQYYEDITWNIIDCMDTELYGARDAYFPDWENGGRDAAIDRMYELVFGGREKMENVYWMLLDMKTDIPWNIVTRKTDDVISELEGWMPDVKKERIEECEVYLYMEG